MKFYDSVKSKLKRIHQFLPKRCSYSSQHPSSVVLPMDGVASLLSLVLVLRRISGSSQAQEPL